MLSTVGIARYSQGTVHSLAPRPRGMLSLGYAEAPVRSRLPCSMPLLCRGHSVPHSTVGGFSPYLRPRGSAVPCQGRTLKDFHRLGGSQSVLPPSHRTPEGDNHFSWPLLPCTASYGQGPHRLGGCLMYLECIMRRCSSSVTWMTLWLV